MELAICCTADPNRFTKLCRTIARHEQILVEISRTGAYQKKRILELTAEGAHWQSQIDLMRSTPGYDIMVDPLELSAKDGHLDCKREINGLRSELVGVRAKKEELFESNALLKGEIRKIRGSRRALKGAKQGRPTQRQARMSDLKAMLEAYTGYPLPSTNGYNLVLSRPVIEKLLGIVQAAERATGQIVHLRPLPVPGQLAPLSSVVAGA